MTDQTTPALLAQVDQISDKRRKTQMERLDKGFDERAAFEAQNGAANSSIQDKLKSYRKKLVLPGIAALTLAAEIDPNFMNVAQGNGNRRFNVYAIDKLADLLQGLSTGHMRNAVNKAIVASLFRFEAASVPFTGLAAQGAVSSNLKVDKGIEGLLVRHTASPGTAPTQSSSTMSALQVLGAVKNVGNARYPVWQLTDKPVVERLREVA